MCSVFRQMNLSAPILSPVAPTDDSRKEMTEAQSSINPGAHPANIWIVSDGHGNFSFGCMWVVCQQQFQTSDQLEAHMDRHLSEYGSEPLAEIVCHVRGCQILVASVEELARHIKMHIFHASRMLRGAFLVRDRCPQVVSCNFSQSFRLVYQGDPLLCEWNSCLQSFMNINEFIGHVQLHVHLLSIVSRNSQDELYGCLWNECQASFENKAHLLRHVQHHSGDKMCACPFCGDSSLVCRFCHKTFPDAALLRKHCLRHLKTQKCQFCSLVLTSPFDLNRHIQTVHANFRCHRCEYCDRTFYQRSDLNRHIELHFNDSIHECQLCGKKFRWSKQLREHARQHQNAFNPTPYECHLCNSRYVRGSALSKHFKTFHQMAIPIGFSRFQYKKCQDGLFRLQTKVHVRGNVVPNEERQIDCK